MKTPHGNLTVKVLAVATFLLAWEIIARAGVFTRFIFPPISGGLEWAIVHHAEMLSASWFTLRILLVALGINICISVGLAMLSVAFRKVRPIVETFVSIFQPIPAMAILPFAMLWFGLGENPIVFVTVFGSMWPLMLNIMNGFATVDMTYVDVGRNYGLKKFWLAWRIMVPAALPNIITGVRAAWGMAWRTVVSAELLFGGMGVVVGGFGGGLGWLILKSKYALTPEGMIAGVIAISVIGIIVEHAMFGYMEKKTVKKWGMKV